MWFLKMRVDLLKVRTNCGMEQLKMETLSQTALIFIPFLLHWITRLWIVRLRNVRCGRIDLFRFLGSNSFILRDRIRYFNQLSTFLAVAWVVFNQLRMIKLVYFSSFVFKNTKFFTVSLLTIVLSSFLFCFAIKMSPKQNYRLSLQPRVALRLHGVINS